MNTGELLRYLRVDILHDDSQQIAGSGDDALWSDESLITNINEAFDRWARQTYAIRDDKTPEVCEVTLEEGVTQYTLHPSVFAVMSARLEDQNADLTRAGHSMFMNFYNPTGRLLDPAYFDRLNPGPSLAYSTDEGGAMDDDGNGGLVSLTVYPTPDEDMDGRTLHLRVVRTLLKPLTIGEPNAVPEINKSHHIEVLDWAAYLCLRTVDLDEGAPDRAKEFAQAFEANVVLARRLSLTKMFARKTWAFGRNGWGGYAR